MSSEKSISDLAKEVIERYSRSGRTLALAESCTGGMISAALTDIAGASDVLIAGFVTYANSAKHDMIDVPYEILEWPGPGAVSEQCAAAMAMGALANSKANTALSVTGIAGPSGGSAEKPVGTVYFGRAIAGQIPPYILPMRLTDKDRAVFREAAVCQALHMLLSIEE